MPKTKHLALKIVGAAVLAFILLLVGVVFWIDSIARIGVEKGATYALGVNTTLQSMNLGILSGQAGMSGLDVANPEGFDAPHFVKLGEGNVAVSLGSLMEDTVVVPELILSDLSMNLERKGGKSNYQVILDHLAQLSGGETKPKQPAETKEGKKFIVRRAAINNVDVQVDLLPLGGSLTRVPLHIDRIELTDIGSDSANGVELAQLTGILMRAILTSVVDKGGNLLPADIVNELGKGLQGLGGLGDATVKVVGDVTTMVDGTVRNITEVGAGLVEELGKSGGQLGEGSKQIGDKVGEGLNDAGKKLEKGLGGLLPGKKKKEDAEKP
ncbi:MAG: hypothetical protein J5J06_12335 [Phycisphaerae bacterium]|nr:hypothetical protein [Phycisphaerae bacterium]